MSTPFPFFPQNGGLMFRLFAGTVVCLSFLLIGCPVEISGDNPSKPNNLTGTWSLTGLRNNVGSFTYSCDSTSVSISHGSDEITIGERVYHCATLPAESAPKVTLDISENGSLSLNGEPAGVIFNGELYASVTYGPGIVMDVHIYNYDKGKYTFKDKFVSSLNVTGTAKKNN